MVLGNVLGFLIFALSIKEVSTIPLCVRYTPEHNPSTALDLPGHSTGGRGDALDSKGLGWRQMHPLRKTPALREEYTELLSDSQKGSL